MSPAIIIMISAIVSVCISKIMAERYLDLTLNQIDEMIKESEEKIKECARSITEALDKKLGLK